MIRTETPPVRPHRDLPEFYAEPERRAKFVARLFDDTARYYDRISGTLSLGTCRAYRKWALRRAGLQPGMRLLDVATGTGLVAQAAMELGVQQIVGVDASIGMLHENRKRRSIALVQGLGESLPFANDTFDFICMGYALRHVEDLNALFAEFCRVLKPGGRVLVLEITRPESRAGCAFGRLYIGRLLPALARLFTGNAEAGRLLEFYWATIAECVPPEMILQALSGAGLAEVGRKKTGSMLSDYSARKPGAV